MMLRAKYANDELKQYEALKKGLEELLTHYMCIPDWNEQFYYDAGLRKGWNAALDEIKKLLEEQSNGRCKPEDGKCKPEGRQKI